MVVFPTGLDTFPTAATLHTHTLATDAHSTLHGNLGAAIAAIEAKVGINGSAVDTSLDARVAALEDFIGGLRGGWVQDMVAGAPAAWGYTNSTTLQVVAAANRTADFYTGLKLQWRDSGGLKYGYVLSSTATGSGPFTTQIATVPNDTYNVDTGIVPGSCFVSAASQPQGFPGVFLFTPETTVSGTTTMSRGSTKTQDGRFRIEGKVLFYEFNVTWGGTGIGQGTGNIRVSLPVAARNIGVFNALGVAVVKNHAATQLTPGTILNSNGAAYVNILTFNAALNTYVTCGASVPNVWQGGDFIQGTATFPIA